MPTFNILIFLLYHRHADVEIQFYNASSENYFLMKNETHTQIFI